MRTAPPAGFEVIEPRAAFDGMATMPQSVVFIFPVFEGDFTPVSEGSST
jgi:hypothetical protein